MVRCGGQLLPAMRCVRTAAVRSQGPEKVLKKEISYFVLKYLNVHVIIGLSFIKLFGIITHSIQFG